MVLTLISKSMKKIKLVIYSLLIIVIVSITSCNVLQKEPLDSLYGEEVWNNEVLATEYINYIYILLMPSFSATTTSSLCDEAFYSSDSEFNYLYGKLNNESVSDFTTAYSTIRKINLLLNEIDKGTIPTSAKRLIKGQAHFFRAWAYWNLVRLYGGVPLVKVPQTPVENGQISEDLYVPRSTTRECIEFIAAELDSAFNMLPAKWDDANYGRITRGAAIAFKGRVLLFWASPQFNPTNKIERWEWAYRVNKKAIEVLESDGYGLHPSFKELFQDCKEKTKEAIMVRVYDASASGNFYHNYDYNVRTTSTQVNKSGGGKRNHVTWQFVKAFPMVDGYPINKASSTYPYRQNQFWVNRDPRFYYTVAYNSDNWPLAGISNYKIWTYYYWKNVNNVMTRLSIEGSSFTSTGFYCKKFVNPSIQVLNVDRVGTDWIEIRFAEVLLNFAECANEIGKQDSARWALFRIRNERNDVKAGMNYIDENINNQEVMREIIMNERQIELAFENKRYWDLRRRNMFEFDLGPNVKKLNGTRRTAWIIELNQDRISKEEFDLVRDQYDYSIPIVYNAYFRPGYEEDRDTESPINYPQPKYNFFPIPQTNLDKNPLLKQNIFWGGTFDPYKE